MRFAFCVSFFLIEQQLLVDQRLLIIEASRPHSDTPHTVGLLWTSDYPDTETCTYPTHNTDKRQTSMPPARFEPANPGSEISQTHTLERADTGFSIFT
jgi:hypothetical protein